MSANNNKNGSDMVDDVDDLDAYIAERDKREPGFAALIDEKLRLRREARARGEDPNDLPPAEEAAEETEDEPTIPHTTR